MPLARRAFLLQVLAASAAEDQKPGQSQTIAGIPFQWCPAGRFRMGSPSTEPGRRPDEDQVDVTLTRSFWIGKYEVTQSQWNRIAGSLRRPMLHGTGDDFPMYWVNYADAERFCRILTGQTYGWEFRLPTKAGTYPANASGIHDMRGYVFEWHRDWGITPVSPAASIPNPRKKAK